MAKPTYNQPQISVDDQTIQRINAGGTETKNIKNSLLAMPVLRTCH